MLTHHHVFAPDQVDVPRSPRTSQPLRSCSGAPASPAVPHTSRTGVRMRMKSPLVMLLVGLPKFGVLVTLDASTRASMRWSPVRRNERNTDMSRFQPPGPRNWFGRVFPKRTPVGDPTRPGRSTSQPRQSRRSSLTGPTRSAVCRLPGVFSVGAVGRDREGRAAEGAEDPVDLPVVDQHRARYRRSLVSLRHGS